MPDENQLAQTQTQQQTITVNLQNSSDPQLELEIFNQLHSAGRQLGRMSDVLDILLQAMADNPALNTPDASAAIEDFRAIRRDIAQLKRSRSPAHYIAQLESLRQSDAVAFQAVITALRQWLQGLGTRD